MRRKNKIFQADLAAFKLLGYVLVFIWGMLCFLPFLLVVMNSFTSEANIMRNGYSFWPGEWDAGSVQNLFGKSGKNRFCLS